MPYLGPKSFKTIPLTSSNLAFLNNNDINKDPPLYSKHIQQQPYHQQIDTAISTAAISSTITPFKQSHQDPIQHQNLTLQAQETSSPIHPPLAVSSESSRLSYQGMQVISPSSNDALISSSYTDKLGNLNVTTDLLLSSNANITANSNNSSNSDTAATNSTCYTESCEDSFLSSETSFTEDNKNDLDSVAESFSYKTLIDVNDDDNKTVVLTASNDNNLLIPPSPLKAYNVVAVSPMTNEPHNQSFEQLSTSNKQPILSSPLPLLRKKSGELIKSSLKLHNLQRSNSMPNTKNVRFATRLENVKFFKKSERPTAVSIHISSSKLPVKKTKWDLDYSSCSSSENDDDDIYNFSTEYNEGINYVDDDSYYYEDDQDEDIDNDTESENFKDSQWIIKSNTCPHNPDSLNFARLANNNDVILESVKLNSAGNSLIGFVYAKNVAFEKKIIVRLTNNKWESFMDFHNSNYISSNHIFKYSDSHSNVYDKFSFIIKLDHLKTSDEVLNLEFCVNYIANKQSFWDNNNNKNYKLALMKNNSKATRKATFSKSNNYKTLYDLDDTNIKLKDNNNFKFDNSNPKTDITSLRTSNSFGLKKIKSEPSLLLSSKSNYSVFNNHSNGSFNSPRHNHYRYQHQHQPHGNNNFRTSPQSINEYFSLSSLNSKAKQYSKPLTSKSLTTSPVLPSIGFDSQNDYDHIIKKFCFFTTSDKPSHIDDLSSTHSDSSLNDSKTTDINSSNRDFFKSHYTIDNFNFSKSQTSIDLY